jgi:Zn-dependent protease with chaperone function
MIGPAQSALLGAILGAPVLLTVWLLRAALGARVAEPARVWFGYWRSLRFILNAMWLAWLAAVFYLGLLPALGNRLTEFSPMLGPVRFAVALVPPAVVALVCEALSYPVLCRLRGLDRTRGDWLVEVMLGKALLVVPALSACLGMGALQVKLPGAAVLCFGATGIGYVVLARLLQRVRGWSLHALSEGALRDRTFALAERAKVKLRQIYVLPAGKWRMANAFASQEGVLLLTDYLLQQLSRREVDAILGHELAHLRHRHPEKLSVLPAVIGVVAGIASVGGFEAVRVPHLEIAAPILIAVAAAAYYYQARRFERTADAGAAELTGDPEALITGLVRLMRLNLLPLHWSRLAETTLTHPSTLRRARRIAARSGIAPDRLEELLGVVETTADRYAEAAALTARERLFSTRFKHRTANKVSWTYTAIVGLVPALGMKVAALLELGGGLRWAAALATVTFTCFLLWLVSDRLGFWGYRRLASGLRSRLENEGIGWDTAEAVFVGFSPEAAVRIYEGHYDWDVGFLLVVGHRLVYLGEDTRWSLRRQQIKSVHVGSGGPSWRRKARVYVSWWDQANARNGALNLGVAGTGSLQASCREAVLLCERLVDWWQHGPAEPSASLDSNPAQQATAALTSPALGQVTGASPRELRSRRVFLVTLLCMSLLAAGTNVLMGVPFDLNRGGHGFLALLISTLALIFQFVPFWRFKDPGETNWASG